MIHEIDLRDHVNVLNPLNFYKYSEEEWEKLTRDSIFYTNRLRATDYIILLKKNNLKVMNIRIKKTKLPKKIDTEIKCAYRYDNLKSYHLIVVSRNEE
jgi:hypothetical protein